MSLGKLLLQAGAQVNVPNANTNCTPLTIALKRKNPDIWLSEISFLKNEPRTLRYLLQNNSRLIKLLLGAGASIDGLEDDLSDEECAIACERVKAIEAWLDEQAEPYMPSDLKRLLGIISGTRVILSP